MIIADIDFAESISPTFFELWRRGTITVHSPNIFCVVNEEPITNVLQVFRRVGHGISDKEILTELLQDIERVLTSAQEPRGEEPYLTAGIQYLKTKVPEALSSHMRIAVFKNRAFKRQESIIDNRVEWLCDCGICFALGK